MPGGDPNVYFRSVDLYHGPNKPGFGRMYLAAARRPHHTQRTQRANFGLVRTIAKKRKADIPNVKSTVGTIQTLRQGWPQPTKEGVLVRSAAMVMAALLWPPDYVFVLPEGEDPTDTIVADIVGEAVAPPLAEAIAKAAQNAQGADLTRLVDLFCCGGGVSLGFANALPSLRIVDGVDMNSEGMNMNGRRVAASLPSFDYNMKRLLKEREGFDVHAHGTTVPTSFDALCKLLGYTPEKGCHIHASPSCELSHPFLRPGVLAFLLPCAHHAPPNMITPF